jgi:hypothetical protein
MLRGHYEQNHRRLNQEKEKHDIVKRHSKHEMHEAAAGVLISKKSTLKNGEYQKFIVIIKYMHCT